MNHRLDDSHAMRLPIRLFWSISLLVTLSLLFWSTFVDIVSIWSRSDTFAHGFIVLPITVFLIWRKRAGLGSIVYQADWRALPCIAVNGFIWLLARLIEVAVIEQLAAVVMVPLLVWLVFGLAALRHLAFPLGFLFFAVPMGEGLIAPLMQFTASFTVFMLRLSGIPVYWEGTFFSIPSGDWSVVAACSGIRYLIASVFLGVLYAYLSYRSLWRRLLFVAASVAVPILANGLRAYLIVMIGHLSGMRLAVGVDHLVYGWVFFGFVMFILFAIGNLWAEREQVEPAAASPTPRSPHSPSYPASSELRWMALGLALLVLWPILGMGIDARSRSDVEWPAFAMSAAGADWQATEADLTTWSPHYLGASETWRRDFRRQNERMGVYLAFYRRDDAELVSSEQVLVRENDPAWRRLEESTRSVAVGEQMLTVTETRLNSSSQNLLVWSWYWINGHQTNRPAQAKLYEALVKLSGQRLNQVKVVFYTPLELDRDSARQRLEGFTGEMMPLLDASLRGLTGQVRDD